MKEDSQNALIRFQSALALYFCEQFPTTMLHTRVRVTSLGKVTASLLVVPKEPAWQAIPHDVCICKVSDSPLSINVHPLVAAFNVHEV